jgi:SWI/SNF-related matrix-associated actin-dependent regulator of chromatin subfamily D
MVRADEFLRVVSIFSQYLFHPIVQVGFVQIFGGVDSIVFQQIPELVNRFLIPPDPVVLHYTVNPAVPPPDLPSAWDIEVKMEDVSLRGRMNVMIQNSKESAQELAKLDEEVCRSIS